MVHFYLPTSNRNFEKKIIMKMNSFFSLTIILAVFLLNACRSDDTITNPPTTDNIITNSSFESGGTPSLQGWNLNTTDSTMINYSTDAPSGGGITSIKLKDVWSFPGTITYSLLANPGTHRYRLTVSGKAIKNASLPAGGEILLMKSDAGTWSTRKFLQFSTLTWTTGSLLDTLTSGASDTIKIMLRGNIDQFSDGYILFDLCKLEQLD